MWVVNSSLGLPFPETQYVAVELTCTAANEPTARAAAAAAVAGALPAVSHAEQAPAVRHASGGAGGTQLSPAQPGPPYQRNDNITRQLADHRDS